MRLEKHRAMIWTESRCCVIAADLAWPQWCLVFVPQLDTAVLPAGQNRHGNTIIAYELHSLLENIDVDKLEALTERTVLT